MSEATGAAPDEVLMLGAALGYAARGWPVVPVSRPIPDQKCTCDRETRDSTPKAHPGSDGLHVGCSECGLCNEPGKHPISRLVPGGVRDATTDEQPIRKWWADGAGYNIGIATGEGSVDVLDADRPVPDRVRKALPGRLGPVVSTGRGEHIYFAPQPAAVRPPGKLSFGEWKADGGMVVAPPSLHPSGRRYSWTDGQGPDAQPSEVTKGLREALLDARHNPAEEQRQRVHADGEALLQLALSALTAGGFPHAQTGDLEYSARCPLHAPMPEPDHGNTALSLRVVDGRLLVHCFANCGYRDVAAGLGIDGQTRLADDPQARIAAVPDEQAQIGPILDEMVDLLNKYMALPVEYAHVVALWVAMTHVYQHCGYAARLRIRSAVYRSGKSRLLEVIAELVPGGRITTHVTQSVFRHLDGVVLLDEMDMWYHPDKHGELTAMLNDGYRAGATITINVKDPDGNWAPEEIPVYRPVAFAANDSARIPAPLADRSLELLLRRKAGTERTARLKGRRYRAEARPLRDRLAAWGLREGPKLEAMLDDAGDEYLMPVGGNDRAADIWEPLAVIAELAGGQWQTWCHEAAALLTDEAEHLAATGDGPGADLLADVRQVFAGRGDPDTIPTKELLADLHNLDESPYMTWGRSGKPLTAAAMARLLRPFRVVPGRRPLRSGEPGYNPNSTSRTPMAYRLAEVEDAHRRLHPQAGRPELGGDRSEPGGDRVADRSLTPTERPSDQGKQPDGDRPDRVTGHAGQPDADLFEVLGAGPMRFGEVAAATGLPISDLEARVASGELERLHDGRVGAGVPL